LKNQHAFCRRCCRIRKTYFTALLIIFCGTLFLFPGKAAAQQDEPEFDEIIAVIKGETIGSAEIPALVIGNKIYLPITDLFNFLTIKNSLSASGHAITGHVMNPKDIYTINRIDHHILYKDSLTKIAGNDLIFSSNEFYLNSDYLGSVFGLQCKFNFRSLTVDFNPAIELPFMREKRLEQMRRNITRLKGETRADTIIKRKFTAFQLGALDWNILSSNYKGNNNIQARIGLGGTLAGGEANAQLNISNGRRFSLKNQYFLWRYVNNDKKYFKQVNIGTVMSAGTLSSIPTLMGVQINNTPTRQRKSFGSYLVSDITQPGWVVELYINDVLVDYTKADASGLFSFEIPLVYGNTNVKYRFYGPWGEERSSEQMINIPFAFLPKKTFDYSLTAGTIQDSLHQPFSRLSLNYGINNHVTIGSGAEYNSSLNAHRLLPFVNASVRLGNYIIFSTDYSPGTVLKGTGNIRFKNKLQMEAQLIKYAPGQQAIRTVSLEERKLLVSMPYKWNKINGFSRLMINQAKFFKGKLKTAEFLMSATRGRINTNITTYAVLFDKAEIMSRIAFNIPMPFNIRFTPQLQYHYQQKQIVLIKAEAERRCFKNMVATVGYDYNKLINTSGFSLGLRHNFSFAQVGFSARQVNNDLSTIQNASGGLLFDNKMKNISASDRSNVGKGTIVILPFLDYNNNGKKDKTEPELLNLNVRVDGCKIDRSYGKAQIKISALEAYNKYFIMLDDKNFDNPAYKIKYKILEVTAEPNRVKQIPVPVTVTGEVGGYLYAATAGGKKGLGRVILHIYDENKKAVAKILTEQDGYFSYLGLLPGKYTIETDEQQLSKIEMLNISGLVTFTIKENMEGDIVDNLEIFIRDKE